MPPQEERKDPDHLRVKGNFVRYGGKWYDGAGLWGVEMTQKTVMVPTTDTVPFFGENLVVYKQHQLGECIIIL